MKIGIFTNAYLPIVSGVVNSIECIRQSLTDLGHQIYIIAPHYHGYVDQNPNVFRYPSLRILKKVDFPIAIPLAPPLSKKLRELELDIIHAQHPFLLGVTGAKLAKRQKIPLVFTFHTRYDQYVHYVPLKISKKAIRQIVKLWISSYLKQCDAIVVPSPSIMDLVKEYGGESRSHLIPNAIQQTPFEYADGGYVQKKYQLDNKKVLIFTGRLAPEKNLSFLLRTIAQLIPIMPNLRLLLVGDGLYHTSLQEQTQQMNLEPYVIFTGMVKPLDVPAYLAAADLFVMPSTTEVNPLALLEAMAAGLPIVAIGAAGALDIVTPGKNGLLTPEDETEFAQAIQTLLCNKPQLNEMRQNAKIKALEFSAPVQAQKLESLYRQLRKPVTLKQK